MTEDNNVADFPKDGDDEFDSFDHQRGESDKDKSTDSPAEKNQDGSDPSPGGGDDPNNQDDPDKDKPFHEHPRWKEREDEHKRRFNDMETRHQEDMKKMREEFSEARKDNAANTQIPSWFGGTQEQWNAYRADRDKELKEAEERAEKRALDKIETTRSQENEKKTTEEKKVQEATEYMHTELKILNEDKKLNPDGLKVDPNKLVQYTIDNMLVDAQGRWDYRKAFRFMKAEGLIKPTTTATKDRKELADATNDKDGKGEPNNTPGVKTSKDFKKNRPW